MVLWCSNSRRMVVLIALLLAATASLSAQSERKVTQLAAGVYEIKHQDSDDGFGSGNTTVIIGARQVLLVDSGFLPSVAREDIAEIRHWTDKPVTFLLNTHFHNDHNLANRTYMDAFPALTVIAHVETKRDMDTFGPGSYRREQSTDEAIEEALTTGKTRRGRELSQDEIKELKATQARRAPVMEELKRLKFQSATLTFDHDFTIDLGEREVQIKFLGRGNTNGDAVVYLPREKIVVAGDLVVYPVPYIYDGYPTEWIQTLDRLAALNATTIVPGHGPIMHDQAYIALVRDLMQSAVDQMNAKIAQTRPAMFQTLEELKGSVDLSSFRQRFVGVDKSLDAAFDDMTTNLIKVIYEEASLR